MVAAFVRKEMLGRSLRAGSFARRSGFLGIVALAALFLFAGEIAKSKSSGVSFGLSLGYIQIGMLTLLAPLVGMAELARDRRGWLVDGALLAGVRPAELVAGAWVARMVNWTLLMASAAPLLLLGTALGGVGGRTALLMWAQSLLGAALGTSLAFALCMGRSSIAGLAGAYMALGLYYFILPAFLTPWATMVSPLQAIAAHALGRGSFAATWLVLIPQAVLALVFAWIGASRLDEDPELEDDLRPPETAPVRAVIAPAPEVREAAGAATSSIGRRISLLVTFVLVSMVLGYNGENGDSVSALGLLIVLGMIAGLVAGSYALAYERSRRTLVFVILAREPREIVRDKLMRASSWAIPFVGAAVLFAALWYPTRPSVAILTAFVGAIGAGSAAGFGLFWSAISVRPATAVSRACMSALVIMGLAVGLGSFVVVGHSGSVLLLVPGLFAIEWLRLITEGEREPVLALAVAGIGIQLLLGAGSVRLATLAVSRYQEA